MCGIAGVLCFDAPPAEPAEAAVARMLTRLGHRGPDGEGQWGHADSAGAWIGLAHARLAILDLTAAGAQPMRRGSAVVTYNGEIYNFKALRAELAADGAPFRTASDTEVLLAGYERWGRNVVERLHGMFAFGLWDADRRSLLLARDRVGIKPLYYCQTDRCLVFASEVRALLASGLIDAQLDDRALWTYLGYQTAASPSTLLRGIRMIEPGHVLEISAAGRVTTRQYWDLLGFNGRERTATEPVAAREEIRARLADAVVSHTVSDVPVGVFLSGGIDSGAVLATLHAAGIRARTFTVGVAGHDCDESEAAAEVAARFGADHTAISLSEDALLGMMPDVLAAIDHPSGDGVNSYVVSRAVRAQGLKVALSGLGGDELFGGYPSFRRLGRMMPVAAQWGRAPGAVRRGTAAVLRAAGGGGVAGTKLADAVESDGTLASLWPVTRQLFSPNERRAMLPETMWPRDATAEPYYALLASAEAAHPDADLWSLVTYAEARAYMHDVLLRDTDQMSMAHGLEVRVPFLDHRVIELVLRLPAALKDTTRPKALLVDSLPAPLPDRVVNAPKRGFALPFDAWMRGALRGFCDAQLGEHGLEGRGLFRPGAVRALWERFLARSPGATWSRVWMLVALNAWLDRNRIAAEPR